VKTRVQGYLAAAMLALGLALPVLAAPESAKPAAKPAGKPAAAGPKKPRRQGGGGMKRVQEALEKLNLTAEQKTKIQALMADVRARGKKLRESTATAEEKKAQRQALGKEVRTRLAAILTPAQQKQLKEMLAAAAKQAKQARQAKAAKNGKPGQKRAPAAGKKKA